MEISPRPLPHSDADPSAYQATGFRARGTGQDPSADPEPFSSIRTGESPPDRSVSHSNSLLGHRRRIPLVFRARGAILMLFAFYLVIGPANQESDVVAAIVGYSILLILALFCATTIAIAHRLRARLTVQIVGDCSEDSAVLRAGMDVPVVLNLSPCSIPPLFVLGVRTSFDHPVSPAWHHHVTGKGDPALGHHRRLMQRLYFEHRGIWKVRSIEFRFGDRFGLTSLRWELRPSDLPNSMASFEIHPSIAMERNLPILTSCNRPGDVITHLQDPQGDPYDLRRYQPSDGVKRIVWKLYAKSGELVSRYPESSVTPEGQVAIYAIADTAEDYVMGTVIRYCEQISSVDMEILASCVGSSSAIPERTSTSFEERVVVDAWRSDSVPPHEVIAHMTEFIEEVRATLRDTSLDRLMIFCSTARISSPEGAAACAQLAEEVMKLRIEPVFFVVDEPATWRSRSEPSLATTRLIDIVWENDFPRPQVSSRAARTAFENMCIARSWTVISVE